MNNSNSTYIRRRKKLRASLRQSSVIKPIKHVKKGDYVKIISGGFKGFHGEIIKVINKKNLVVIKDVNVRLAKVFVRDENGSYVKRYISKAMGINSSNVMLFDKENNICKRVGFKFDENNKKVRYFKI